MKLCWDNLENLKYSKRTGKWYDERYVYYVYVDKCKECSSPFLALQESKGDYCCRSCSKRGRNNPMYHKQHTEKSKKMMRQHNAVVGGVGHPFYGKHHTVESKRKIGDSSRGKRSNFWKGGVTKKNLPLYNTYAPQIDWCEEVRRSPSDGNVLEVRCTYCGKWFVPKRWNVLRRAQYLKGNWSGENRLYCSVDCKRACPIYGKNPTTLMREDAIKTGRLQWLELNREVQPELRKIVLERDDYTCQKCGTQDKPIHCHHILPVATNPIESADVDNCITYCIDCHKQAHDQDGCRYKDLQTEIC